MGYLHHVPGRLRVRVAAVKRDPARAAALTASLEKLPGVQRAEVNALTGSALIHYRPDATDAGRLVAHLRERRWIPAPHPQAAPAGLEQALARVILQSAAEVLVQRSLFALAAALL